MANRHTSYDLAQMQSVPLEGKITMTKLRIQQWYDHWEGQVYISFSGGKDSTVLKHIIDQMYDDVPSVFANTGLEYPEIQKFAREIKAGKYDCFNPDMEIIRPEMRFDEVIKKYGYPVISKEVADAIYEVKRARARGRFDTRRDLQLQGKCLSPDGSKSPFNKEKWAFLLDAPFDVGGKCCAIMKKKPFHNYEKRTKRKPYIGTMAYESRLRKSSWIRNGCNVFDGTRISSRPLSFWTEQDVLKYLKKYNVPYCPVYGEIVPTSDEDQIEGQITTFDILGDYDGTLLKTTGCNRTGCIFCGFGCHLDAEPNRYQRLKETHKRQYEYCIGGGEMVDGKWKPSKEGLGIGKVLDYIGVDYD